MKTARSLSSLSQTNILFMRLAGGIFIGLGLLLISSGRLTTLTCTRVGAKIKPCQLVSSSVLGSLNKETQLIELQGVKVNNNPMDDDTARVILLSKSGEIPFTTFSKENKLEIIATASDINNFIQDVEKASLIIQQDGRSHYLQMGGFIVVLGLFTWLFSENNKSYLVINDKQESRANR